MFQLLIINSRLQGKEQIVYQGSPSSVVLPGEEGEFEILDFHRPIISRLKKGSIIVDNKKEIPIKGGLAKMDHQKLVAMVDL